MLLRNDLVPTGVVAKLADFGLSMAQDPNATHISNYGRGTVAYMAPEVQACVKPTLPAV